MIHQYKNKEEAILVHRAVEKIMQDIHSGKEKTYSWNEIKKHLLA